MSRHVRDIRWHHNRLARRGAFGVVESDIQVLHARTDATTSSCKEGDTSPECELPAGATSKLPMILGAA